LQDDVNAVIKKILLVGKLILTREKVEKEFDLTILPSSVRRVRIVELRVLIKRLARTHTSKTIVRLVFCNSYSVKGWERPLQICFRSKIRKNKVIVGKL
jgi:hypothetical protein